MGLRTMNNSDSYATGLTRSLQIYTHKCMTHNHAQQQNSHQGHILAQAHTVHRIFMTAYKNTHFLPSRHIKLFQSFLNVSRCCFICLELIISGAALTSHLDLGEISCFHHRNPVTKDSYACCLVTEQSRPKTSYMYPDITCLLLAACLYSLCSNWLFGIFITSSTHRLIDRHGE